MRIVAFSDVFPPLRSSGAVQMRDLVTEFGRQGHEITIVTPAPDLEEKWRIEQIHDARILWVRSPGTKGKSYLGRAAGEFLLPYYMLKNMRASPLGKETWDGVVWYSPSIFLGPVANSVKRRCGCRGYLIVRDVFPEWAVDMGLLRKGVAYRIFKAIESYQYSVADVIGVQTPANIPYFSAAGRDLASKVEVLENWLAPAPITECRIDIKKTPLAGRKIFVYAGNMGVAQGIEVLLHLAESLVQRKDLGFVFVGRGSETANLRKKAESLGLDNVLFFDEIEPEEIAGLYAQCDVGLISLDTKHTTHNIPGKLLSYLHSGLPVLARINPGNDLVSLIKENRIGRVSTDDNVDSLQQQTIELLELLNVDPGVRERCKRVANERFSPATAVRQIIDSLQ